MPSVSIIGTAGRMGLHKKMSKQMLERMCVRAASIITEQFGLSWNNVDLVSGGAAWADHVAVLLFYSNSPKSLTLHLPCNWDYNTHTFVDSGNKDWRTNPGRTANKLHTTFSEIVGTNTLLEIEQAEKKGAHLNTSAHGFHNRNTLVSQSDFIIAFTWSPGAVPESGGTADTWKKAKGVKVHVALDELVN